MTDKILILAGPTASGKSNLSLRLAKELNAEIVSLDSVQIYQGFDIGSAKPSKLEQYQIKHHLIDIASATSPLNAYQVIELAQRAISDIQSRGKLALVCAGTTLYLRSLLHGLVEISEISKDLRDQVRTLSDEALYAELSAIDPISASRIHKNDRIRLERALEIYRATATPASTMQQLHGLKSVDVSAEILVLCWQRQELRVRIAMRVEQMLEQGLIDEVKALKLQIPADALIWNSIGYKEVFQFLDLKANDSNKALSELVESITVRTSQFAKRQLTFLRQEPIKRGWRIFPEVSRVNISTKQKIIELDGATDSPRSNKRSILAYEYSYNELLDLLKERFQDQQHDAKQGVTLFNLSAKSLGS